MKNKKTVGKETKMAAKGSPFKQTAKAIVGKVKKGGASVLIDKAVSAAKSKKSATAPSRTAVPSQAESPIAMKNKKC